MNVICLISKDFRSFISIWILAMCFCEFQHRGNSRNGILCNTTDGEFFEVESCKSDEVCTSDEIVDYSNFQNKLCEQGKKCTWTKFEIRK